MFEIKKVIISTGFIRILGALIGIFSTFFILTLAEPDNSALVFIILSIFLMLTSPITNGLARTNVRELSARNRQQKDIYIKEVVTKQASNNLTISLVCSIIAVIYISNAHLKINEFFLFISFFIIASLTFNRSLMTSIIRSDGRVILGNLDGLLIRPISMLIFFLAFYCFFINEAFTFNNWLIIPLVLSFITSYVFVLFFTKHKFPFFKKPNIKVLKNSSSLMLLSGSEIAFNNITILSLGLLASATDILTIKLFFTIKTAALLCITASSLFSPYLFAAYNIKDADKEKAFKKIKLVGVSISIIQAIILIPIIPILANYFSSIHQDIFIKASQTLLILIPIFGWLFPRIEIEIAKGKSRSLLDFSIFFNVIELISVPIIFICYGLYSALILSIFIHILYLICVSVRSKLIHN